MVLPGYIGLDSLLRISDGIKWASETGKLVELVKQQIWLILLDEKIAHNIEPENAQSIIAHEIVHAWLGHDRHSPDIPKDCEIQAATLTGQWGFQGLGSDVEYCNTCSKKTLFPSTESTARGTNLRDDSR